VVVHPEMVIDLVADEWVRQVRRLVLEGGVWDNDVWLVSLRLSWEGHVDWEGNWRDVLSSPFLCWYHMRGGTTERCAGRHVLWPQEPQVSQSRWARVDALSGGIVLAEPCFPFLFRHAFAAASF
jgi:hypothetical protein